MDPILQPLVQAGALGLMLCWFAVRAENRLDALARAVNRQTKAQLLLVMALAASPGGFVVREQAQALLDETEADTAATAARPRPAEAGA
jgi:hypothetical protein